MNPFCHREERSDVAIHLEFVVDCRSRQTSFAMTIVNRRKEFAFHSRGELNRE